MKQFLFIALVYFNIVFVFGQKPYTLEQCEALFQKNNLELLAEQYAISSAKANVIQAKIWEHPYISGEINAINPQHKRYFDAGSSGQKTLAIQQLIYLGRKKKKEVDFAKSNATIAALQYEQLLLNLRFEIHQNFYGLYFNQLKFKSINAKMANIDTLITVYSAQEQRGNVSLKDVVRLQSLSLTFKSDLMEIQQEIFQQQENLKILTHTDEYITPIVNEKEIDSRYAQQLKISEAELQAIALEKNPDYLTALQLIESETLHLKWQKSLAVPDVTLGANYDQRGGAFNNQVNLTLGIPLPLWNKNKGNIQIAQAELEQSKVMKEQKMEELKSKVSTALNIFLYEQKQYNQTASNFQNLEKVYSGIFQNFQKQNISLIEFTDFMESYNQSVLFLNNTKKQLILNGETLNHLTNQKIL